MRASEVLGRYKCPVCDSRFDSVGDKKRHMRRKHSDDED
jgi:hypothetical protein